MLRRLSKGIASAARPVLKSLPELMRDAAALGAVGSISYGAWTIYAPAGFIVGGLLILTGSILTARN